MVDKYGTGQDPYSYEGTDILINKFDIRDATQLQEAERDFSEIAAMDIEFSEPPYDFSYWCSIHQLLFSDIYEWAGKTRTIDISKGNTRFCAGRFIERESQKLLGRVAKDNFLNGLSKEELIPKLAEYYSELNVIHPFRDGNGRAQRILFEHIVVNTGHTISYELISKSDWIQANIDGYNCDYRALESIFNKCISG
jgi:cell filamentation protein